MSTIQTQLLQLFIILFAIILPLAISFFYNKRVLNLYSPKKIFLKTVITTVTVAFIIFIVIEVATYAYLYSGGSIRGGAIEMFTIPYLFIETFLGLIMAFVIYLFRNKLKY